MMPALRHQKAGSRMGGPLAQLELHQIRVEGCEGSVEPATQSLYNPVACFGHPSTGIGVVKPCGKVCRQAIAIVNQLGPMHAVERAVYFCEIPDMRSMHNCAAQLGSLDWILSAMSDQRAANEHRRR